MLQGRLAAVQNCSGTRALMFGWTINFARSRREGRTDRNGSGAPKPCARRCEGYFAELVRLRYDDCRQRGKNAARFRLRFDRATSQPGRPVPGDSGLLPRCLGCGSLRREAERRAFEQRRWRAGCSLRRCLRPVAASQECFARHCRADRPPRGQLSSRKRTGRRILFRLTRGYRLLREHSWRTPPHW
jgi:hypothetical protein